MAQKPPETAQNGRSYVITSRRRYVMTSFFIWYDALKLCSCLYQIWSKSVEKHGHSGPKTPKMAQNGRFYVITSRRRCVVKISTPSLHPPHPPLHPVQVSWRSIERSRSLSCCKKVVVVVVGGSSNEWPISGLFSRPPGGGCGWRENFFGWNLPWQSQPPTQNIKWSGNDHLVGVNVTN